MEEKDTQNVFEYITSEKTAYETTRIPLASNYDWNMYEHIDKSFQLKNSQFTKGKNDHKRPFKNIILPIANVNYRTEGFDVKDVELYVDNEDYYHLSLLGRKYHNQWALKYSIDTSIDESVESYFDYGLALAKNVNEERPEIVNLQEIAFCDQTDVLSGPICLIHHYSIDQLLEFKGKWDDEEIDMAVTQAQSKKNVSLAQKDAKTPGKYIEVYELHGMFPETWLNKNGEEEYTDDKKYVRQLHIVTFYKNADGKNTGISLFKGKSKNIFKAIKRDPIFGRACGRGGIEELFDSQIWTNYSEIHLQQMLEAVSKVVLKTTDKKLASQNKFNDLKNNQIVYVEEGKTFDQVPIQAINKTAFDNYVNAWEQTARTIGSASDPQLGLNSKSGTPLGETQIVTAQGEGIHDYRGGKLKTWWGEIYRDWVLDYLKKEMNRGDQWLDELTVEELQEVAERVSTNLSNKRVKELVLRGKLITTEERDLLKQTIKEEFIKGGKKRFLKIMKDEFAKLPLKLKFSVAGKQRNLQEVVSKLNNVFRAVFANPQILQAPGMDKLFNQILESSGMSPIDFSSFTSPQQSIPSPMQPQMQQEQLTTNTQ